MFGNPIPQTASPWPPAIQEPVLALSLQSTSVPLSRESDAHSPEAREVLNSFRRYCVDGDQARTDAAQIRGSQGPRCLVLFFLFFGFLSFFFFVFFFFLLLL